MPTTASEWLEEHGEDVVQLEEMLADLGLPVSVFTELPGWMKKDIVSNLRESFEQPYWRDIHLTTAGDAERVLETGLTEGWSMRRMADEIAESMGNDHYSRVRAMNIARTEAGGALNLARRSTIDRLAEEIPELSIRPSWLSVLGPTTRDTHAILDGVPADEDGMWDVGGYMAPCPRHWSLPAGERCNCFPEGTLVSGDFVGAQRAWYEGEFTEIVTRNGAVLTLTINHPVVTSEGLVAAGEIEPGDKVLTYRTDVDGSLFDASVLGKHDTASASLGEPSVGSPADGCRIGSEGFPDLPFACRDDVQHEPTVIEKVFETLAGIVGVEFVRAGVGDFHGDGQSVEGYVEVVWADGKLLEYLEAGDLEEGGDEPFVFPGPSDVLPVELGFGPGGESPRRVDCVPSGGPCIAETTSRHFLSVGRITPAGTLAVGVASDFDASLNDSLRQDGPGVSGFLRESLERHAGSVAFDDVVQVRHFYSSGHVYDLHSRYGLIVASDPLYTDNHPPGIGIVVKNCQCSITTEFGMDDAEAWGLIQDYADRQAELEAGEGEAAVRGLRTKGDLPGHEFRGNQWSEGGTMAPDSGGGIGGALEGNRLLSSREWFDSLGGDDRKSVERWLYGGHFGAIKKGQLNPEKASEKVKQDIVNMDRVLDFCPLFSGTTYRGVSLASKEVPAFLKNMKLGTTFTTKTFTSSSDTESGSKFYSRGKDVGVTIVMNGKSGHDLRDATEGVPEVLFKSGISFKVEKVSRHDGGKSIVVVVREVD